jgi:hypothetical protein
MKKKIETSLVVLSSLAMAACGAGGAPLGGGKQGAAQAVFQASQAGRGASGTGGLLQLLQQRAVNVSTIVKGDAGGSAAVTVDVGATQGATSVAVTIAYSDFSEDGKNRYNGTMSVTVKVGDSGTGVDGLTHIHGSVQVAMKGKLTISGDVSDFVDADITESVDFSALQGGGNAVSVVIDGGITTSSAAYQYAHESVSVSSSAELPVAAATK